MKCVEEQAIWEHIEETTELFLNWGGTRRASEGRKHLSQVVTGELEFLKFIILFIYFWLCWVFLAPRVFLQFWRVGAALQLLCTGLPFRWLLVAEHWLQGAASAVMVPRLQRIGSRVVAHGLSCSVASGIFLDQELNLCLLHWQADSLP